MRGSDRVVYVFLASWADAELMSLKLMELHKLEHFQQWGHLYSGQSLHFNQFDLLSSYRDCHQSISSALFSPFFLFVMKRIDSHFLNFFKQLNKDCSNDKYDCITFKYFVIKWLPMMTTLKDDDAISLSRQMSTVQLFCLKCCNCWSSEHSLSDLVLTIRRNTDWQCDGLTSSLSKVYGHDQVSVSETGSSWK